MAISLLIVDDIEDNRVALKMRLALAGYDEVAEAANGREALDTLRSGEFDLMLLDVMMPEMNGFQVLEEMKSDTDLREVSIIMVSALDDMESLIRCIELGAVDYLTKPFNPALLKTRIDSVAERIQLRAQQAEYLRIVEEEKARAEKLLATVLPRQIARILKSNRRLPPIRYDDVSLMFCDIVGFTEYAEANAPEIVFDKLESLIDEFEQLAEQHGLMKVKTIGDAIVIAGGLLSEIDDPVRAVTACAMDIVEAARQHDSGWQIRVGIDYGPVMAGVIGRTQFQFDVWGDVVNTASRIQSISAPNTVNLSGRAWQNIRNVGRGRSLGMVELKGKQSIEVIECQELRL
jgi:class 3 adenylate cyclase